MWQVRVIIGWTNVCVTISWLHDWHSVNNIPASHENYWAGFLLRHTIPYHTIPYHTISYHTIHTTPHHTTPYYTTPHRTTPRHTTPHRTTSHHITSHHTTHQTPNKTQIPSITYLCNILCRPTLVPVQTTNLTLIHLIFTRTRLQPKLYTNRYSTTRTIYAYTGIPITFEKVWFVWWLRTNWRISRAHCLIWTFIFKWTNVCRILIVTRRTIATKS